MKNKINIIAAIDSRNGIGKRGTIPWYIPQDMKFFKNLTKNNIVIMGSKTFASLCFKPLSDRLNIVITKDLYKYEFINGVYSNLKFFSDVETALGYALSIQKNNLYTNLNNTPDIYVIGGNQIYTYILDNHFDLINNLYLTIINKDFKCDTFYPYKIDFKNVYESQTYDAYGLDGELVKYRFIKSRPFFWNKSKMSNLINKYLKIYKLRMYISYLVFNYKNTMIFYN
jgi:dihydrofolate reductase